MSPKDAIGYENQLDFLHRTRHLFACADGSRPHCGCFGVIRNCHVVAYLSAATIIRFFKKYVINKQ